MSDATDDDLRDVFKLLYDDDEWASDDGVESVLDARESTAQPEIDQVEAELDPYHRHLERYSRKRFMTDLDGLLRPSAKRQRVFNASGTATASSSSVPSMSPFPDLPSPSTYAPFSPLPLLARLRTFHPSSYSPYIPSPLDAVHAALSGWINDGRDSLSCGMCRARWALGEVAEIREEKVRVEVARRLNAGLGTKHARNCAWRVNSCPVALYAQLRTTLHPPVATSLSALARHIELESLTPSGTHRWTSPLSTPQLDRLATRMTSSDDASTVAALPPGMVTDDRSRFAAALALFCWYPFHPNGPLHSLSSARSPTTHTDILQCRLCERRVGLWAYTGDGNTGNKAFDLVGEHLGWCPVRGGHEGKEWWTAVPLLQEKEKGVGVKDWIQVSHKLEPRSWRREQIAIA